MRLAEPLDQATGLRRLFASARAFRALGVLGPDARRNARVCAELALGLSRRGNQVLVLDGVHPPYNVGGVWGLLPRRTLADVPGRGADDAVLEAGPGIRLLAAPDGMNTLAAFSEQSLIEVSECWGEAPEWMLLNGETGTGGGLAATAELRLLVLPGDRTRLADAYAILKSAHGAWSGGTWLVLVEGADPDRAQALFNSLKDTASRFLGIEPGYLGCLPKPRQNNTAAEGLHGGLLAESLQAMQGEQSINFEQYWQRMWLFSRMALDSVGGKSRHADRRPG